MAPPGHSGSLKCDEKGVALNWQPEPTNHKSVNSTAPEYCWRTWICTYNAVGAEKLGSHGSKSAETCGTVQELHLLCSLHDDRPVLPSQSPLRPCVPDGMPDPVTGQAFAGAPGNVPAVSMTEPRTAARSVRM